MKGEGTNMNICVECVHHRVTVKASLTPGYLQPVTHSCANRDLADVVGNVDPVTGLGECSALNPTGQCSGFLLHERHLGKANPMRVWWKLFRKE